MKTNTLFFSTEPGVYHGWQSALLVKTAREYLDLSRWNIVRAVAIFPDKSAICEPLMETLSATGCTIHIHSNYAAEITAADCYSPYNKILALRSFITESELPEDHLITIIDPDFLLVKEFLPQASAEDCSLNSLSSDVIWAEEWAGLDPKSEFGVVLGRFLNLDADKWSNMPSVGVPVTLSVYQLKILVDDWLAFSLAIRRGFNSGELRLPAVDAWCAEMWGFMAAAAHSNLRIVTTRICRFANDDALGGAAFIHYCHSVNDSSGRPLWDKRWYEPVAAASFNPAAAGTEVGVKTLKCL